MKKIFVLTVLLFVLISCYDGPPPKRVFLDVPYFPWLAQGYCAIACIQMWAAFDGIGVTQDEIASYIGTYPNPFEVVNAVNVFTNSFGWLEYEDAILNAQAQDLCISYSIACIEDHCPSIMPFEAGNHGVLTIGYKWTQTPAGFPMADYMDYHDPNPVEGGYLRLPGNTLKVLFQPAQGYYFVIVGYRFYVDAGRIGYAAFLDAGGTYRGGPAIYYPQ